MLPPLWIPDLYEGSAKTDANKFRKVTPMVASFLPGSVYFKFSKSNLSTLTKFDYLVKSGNRLDPIQKSLAVFENKTIKILQQNNQSFNL